MIFQDDFDAMDYEFYYYATTPGVYKASKTHRDIWNKWSIRKVWVSHRGV